MRFIKMHGIGNDYVYVNGFSEAVDDPNALAVKISDRHTGVGGDGLILVLPAEPGVDAHLRMRMFNADGSESEMCGNGIRCVCKLAYDHNVTPGVRDARPMKIQTGAGVLSLDYTLNGRGEVDQVTVDMGEPILEPAAIPIALPKPAPQQVVNFPLGKFVRFEDPTDWMDDCGLEPKMTCVSMGNPHMILFCRRVKAVPVAAVGPKIERQSIFPRRVNLHFVEVRSSGEVVMRTWERGSGVTQACGTGACAVCVAGVLAGKTDRKLTAHLPGGDLALQWREADNHVYMTGPAVEVFQGDWSAG